MRQHFLFFDIILHMEVAIWSDPNDVGQALARLGLGVAPLSKALLVGYLARISCTANDAPNAPGFYQWNATLRSLREDLVLLQWTRCDDGNFATVVDPTGKIAVTVASGNADTGRAHLTPTTRSSKGPNTAAAVSINAGQMELFPELIEALPIHDGERRVTWILLFHADGKELRGELSLPVSMDEEGHIKAWKERIILPSQPLDSGFTVREPEFGPEVDIDIQRRA